jgi:hypothetical protein
VQVSTITAVMDDASDNRSLHASRASRRKDAFWCGVDQCQRRGAQLTKHWRLHFNLSRWARLSLYIGSQAAHRGLEVGVRTQAGERQTEPNHGLCDFGAHADKERFGS